MFVVPKWRNKSPNSSFPNHFSLTIAQNMRRRTDTFKIKQMIQKQKKAGKWTCWGFIALKDQCSINTSSVNLWEQLWCPSWWLLQQPSRIGSVNAHRNRKGKTSSSNPSAPSLWIHTGNKISHIISWTKLSVTLLQPLADWLFWPPLWLWWSRRASLGTWCLSPSPS